MLVFPQESRIYFFDKESYLNSSSQPFKPTTGLFDVKGLVCQWKMFKVFAFFVQLYSVEQLQHMHSGLSQQLVGGMTLRGNRGSVGSLDGGRLFTDAMAWISQQKVSEMTTYRIRWQRVEQQTPCPLFVLFSWQVWGYFWLSSRLSIQSSVLTLWFASP